MHFSSVIPLKSVSLLPPGRVTVAPSVSAARVRHAFARVVCFFTPTCVWIAQAATQVRCDTTKVKPSLVSKLGMLFLRPSTSVRAIRDVLRIAHFLCTVGVSNRRLCPLSLGPTACTSLATTVALCLFAFAHQEAVEFHQRRPQA